MSSPSPPRTVTRLSSPGDAKYLAWYREITLRTARLAAAWQSVGFVHGVLNTDNSEGLGFALKGVKAVSHRRKGGAVSNAAVACWHPPQADAHTPPAPVLASPPVSILGLTIDYGPYGWLDKFDPYWSPNLTDIQSGRRYCYRRARARELVRAWRSRRTPWS